MWHAWKVNFNADEYNAVHSKFGGDMSTILKWIMMHT
jgi:hypothetical protein